MTLRRKVIKSKLCRNMLKIQWVVLGVFLLFFVVGGFVGFFCVVFFLLFFLFGFFLWFPPFPD